MQEGAQRENATPINLNRPLHYRKEKKIMLKRKGWRLCVVILLFVFNVIVTGCLMFTNLILIKNKALLEIIDFI